VIALFAAQHSLDHFIAAAGLKAVFTVPTEKKPGLDLADTRLLAQPGSP